MHVKIDDKDRTIISMYARDPHVSQDDIAEELGMSQPSVALRIRKLRESGAMETLVGVNPQRMGLNIAKVDVSTNDTNELLSMFRNCPFFMNGFVVSGRYNLCLLFMSEDIATMESIINGHIRPNPNVREVDFNIIISSARPFVVPTDMTASSNRAPCGYRHQCKDCPSFAAGNCLGCPVIGQYKGWFF